VKQPYTLCTSPFINLEPRVVTATVFDPCDKHSFVCSFVHSVVLDPVSKSYCALHNARSAYAKSGSVRNVIIICHKIQDVSLYNYT
jgi:hypothetical protein